MRAAFNVYGTPIPKGSMKCVGRRGNRGHVVIDSKIKTLKPWQAAVAAGARAEATRGVFEGPVRATLLFTLPRPSSVKPAARPWPSARSGGDLDKLTRGVWDGLQDGGLITDDAQIVLVTAVKFYPDTPYNHTVFRLDRPGCAIRLESLT